MYGVWQGLLADLAIVAAVITLWANLRNPLRRLGSLVETVAFGLVMSGGTILAMVLGVGVAPGIIFDLRVTPLAVAGFFGGPLVAGIAAVPALLYRVSLGGSGVWAGCTSVVLVAASSALQRKAMGARPARSRDILLLAATMALADVLSMLALPRTLGLPFLLAMGLPKASLDIIGVLLAGLSILGKERRDELVRSNAVYRAIIEALPDCLNVKDLAGRFIAANPATARLMGAASADDLIGRTDFDFYPEETARGFREDECAALSVRQAMSVEQHATFTDGRQAWLSTLKVPFRDARGAVIGLITHNRDVTVTKVMQLELNSARQHLADALANMADGLVMYDAEGRILMCNAQYRAHFPLTADLRFAGARLPDILREAVARGEEILPPDLDIETWIAEILMRLKRGGDRVIALADGRWIEARTRPVADGGSLSVFSDVTTRKQEEQALRFRAEHDPLTGLANRAAFEARLAAMYAHAHAQGTTFAVLLMDLDRFKQVNDRFGHTVGDHLLVNVGRRLEAACRHGDLVARLGGDEFAVLSEGLGADNGLPRLARRILDGLAMPFEAGSVSLQPGGSIGYAVFPHDGTRSDILMIHADQALYAAKASGRGKVVAYSTDLSAVAAQ